MLLAETIIEDKRPIYFDFVKNHTMDAEPALSARLRSRLVDKRKQHHKSRICCSSNLYNFVSFVESVFLNNLTLKIMIAYSKGDLVYAITCHLTRNKTSFANFSTLYSKDDSQNKIILGSVLDMYTNMRGMYFVKHIRD